MHDRDHRETTLTEGPACGDAGRAHRLRGKIAWGSRRQRRRESGQAVLEFAMVLPFLLALVLLLVDFGKAMGYWINATQVANEGARYASVNAPGGDITSYVNQALFPELKDGSPNVGPNAPAAVSVCLPDGPDIGSRVTVKIASAYRVTVLPFLGGSFTLANIPIKTSATMRLERPATFAESGPCT
jgi:Flp pilus assembly protein TadG